MQTDIAVIGMAGRFPEAGDISQLLQNLSTGRDSVRELSYERIKATTLDNRKRYMIAGYLENIDLFDAAFFNISPAEAGTMDPHIRLLLEVAHETFENAGYSSAALERSNTSVFVADAALEYYKHADEFVPTLTSGNTKAFLSTTLSRQFDLRGNSLVVDTTCSSSLMAVHLACNELTLGDADLALACAANLYLFPYKEGAGLGLDSPDGRSKAFSAAARGMSHGEAVVCVLLKPLQKALADGDIIHAVIKGSATNCNARRSASLTAPDSQAQAEVIKKAWEKAGIDPRRIGFIEAHGSGTELGDNIEVGGFTMAFDQFTGEKGFCPISTIKSNIGHTRSAAGLSGLVKTILSLKHRVLFPSVHFERPHPQINFDRSAVYVNRGLRSWETTGEPRIAGVSSIGLSGTNCHVILEEAPPVVKKTDPKESRLPSFYLLPISSATGKGLSDNIKTLRDHLSRVPDADVADVSLTLAAGRNHYRHRAAILADSIPDAIARMDDILKDFQEDRNPVRSLHNLVFVFEDAITPVALLNYFDGAFDVFHHYYSALSLVWRQQITDPALADHLLFQYCFFRLLESRGITANKLLAKGSGKMITDIINNKVSPERAPELLLQYTQEATDQPSAKIASLLQQETAKGPVAFISVGAGGRIADELGRQAAIHKDCQIIRLAPELEACPFLKLLQSLYLLNYELDWTSLYKNSPGRRIELPAYRFQKKRYWLRETPRTVTNTDPSGEPFLHEVEHERSSREDLGYFQELRALWEEVLQVDNVSATDDFFLLGGDSLKATRLINRINTAYGVRLSFEDMFDFPVLRSLMNYLEGIISPEQKLLKIWKDVLKQDDLGVLDDFFEAGGHSLIANQIINRIRSWWGLEINFDDFFAHPTVRSLSSYLNDLRANPSLTSEIPQLSEQEYYEVSHAQKRLWILSQSSGGALAYNQPGVYEIRSPLDPVLLQRAFDALIQRHESLRTTFLVKDEHLVQRIHAPGDSRFKLEYLDYRGRDDAKDAALLRANQSASRSFDLEKGPLIRALLIHIGDNAYVFLLDLHHIITDGWSNGVLIHDLLVIYSALKEGRNPVLPPLRIQYKDYSVWQNQRISRGDMDIHKTYWIHQFDDPADPLELPADGKRPDVKNYRGGILEFSLGPELTQRLKDQGRQTDTTVFMLLLANLYILLYRFSGQRDITIGTPIAGRDHIELEHLIGFFANTLAFRARMEIEDKFETFLEQVKQNTLHAYAHSAYPFDLLVDQLLQDRQPGRSPLFDVMLTLQNMENEARYRGTIAGQLNVTSYETDIRVSKFDLTICVSENEGALAFLVEYDTDLFKEKTILRIKENLMVLFDLTTSLPELSIGDLRARLYQQVGNDQLEFYRTFSESNLEE
ncbi:MAG: hypothetical protein J0H74_12925 [Chitinophagaceae bacterium]|nr:hypothetical protein [Chitinophagaceae bacterium]